jgi:FKBP-type peptidyl-prolyl cis-trans isomerase SlyD
MQIAERHVAYFHYTLTNDAGETLDSSAGREPLPYLHGAGNIVQGLEKALAGKKAGDKLTVDVAPKSAFQGVTDLAPGMQFQAESNMGPVSVVVTEISGDNVTVDGNHPLAGETLHFAVEITEVREATTEEVLHGHVHGAGGHHH